MLSLSSGDFDLAANTLIEVRVSSINSQGQSLPSEINTEGARVRAIPGKAYSPTEGDLTSHNQIEVVWQAMVTAEETGNSPILSYQLIWDNKSGTTDITVIESDTLSHLIEGLDEGSDYKFIVVAKNVYGYGPPSDEVIIRASDVPDAMSTVNIVSIGDELQFFWTEPNNGGDAITEYQLELYIPST